MSDAETLKLSLDADRNGLVLDDNVSWFWISLRCSCTLNDGLSFRCALAVGNPPFDDNIAYESVGSRSGKRLIDCPYVVSAGAADAVRRSRIEVERVKVEDCEPLDDEIERGEDRTSILFLLVFAVSSSGTAGGRSRKISGGSCGNGGAC